MGRKKALNIITNKQRTDRMVADPGKQRQMRKDYTQMRDVMQKRIRRAQAAGYLKGRLDIPTLKEINSSENPAAALSFEYSRLSKLIENDNYNVGGFRKEAAKRVASFHELGYDFVTEENEIDFGEYMGILIEKYTKKDGDDKDEALWLDSDTIVKGYDWIRKRTQTTNHDEIYEAFSDYLKAIGKEDPLA